MNKQENPVEVFMKFGLALRNDRLYHEFMSDWKKDSVILGSNNVTRDIHLGSVKARVLCTYQNPRCELELALLENTSFT